MSARIRVVAIAVTTLAAALPPAKADELSAKVDMIVTGALGPQNDAEKYCRNIADAAREAKFEWQVKTIAELEEALAERTRSLEANRAEVEGWLEKRERFMDLAEERLVGIYSKMPRISSAILNEMPAEQAAGLAALMIESGKTPEGTSSPEAENGSQPAGKP
jgi:flagellar motility protein MotE (MotC chaperone)